ncbi:MAG TPA: single-stranded-DNA-specific exonuclease RecJ [Gaiellaceae bacterium]|jgi:single-stranded-DNA-specific exonuclease|nr:single-stranded-DNA-specific exonuclease RecJ [Gaiellaceae bacterium]
MSWQLRSECERPEVEDLARELSVSQVLAAVLVRRGHTDSAAARAFLAAELPEHDPFQLGDMREACEAIHAAIAAGTKICVHGDYDADGICATALAVLVLGELGADVTWHLPSRFDEGYGVGRETLTRLAGEGIGLVLTVDCGVTAVEEVAHARELGLAIVVTDHHRPGPELPDCPVVGPYRGEYPFRELCGTGVVWKLGQALLGTDSDALARHLDLVAVATVADVVPLVDENRGLAVAGLRQLARTQKPGLQALMRSARVDAAAIDAAAIGFRLAPRLNAAGRLGRPEAALELLLTEETEPATQLAAQLEELNRDRQAVEERILREAVEEIESWPEAQRRRRAFVVAGADWHEGVIGIVASRLVERYNRPVVLIAGTDGNWKGSGRSIPGFDLHDGLRRCAGDLERWGGHAAAAGLSIKPERVPAFAEAFSSIGDAELAEDDLRPPALVDALVHGRDLTLELCNELAQLAPFGLGNPNVTLLLAGCQLVDLAAVGEGKHLKFRVREDGRDSGSAIAFRMGRRLDSLRRAGAYDLAFKLEANQWNGTVAPQLNVRHVFEADERYVEKREWLKAEWRSDDRDPVAAAIFEELGLAEGGARRHLLESERFLALMSEPALARAA